jgi:hypothetical protein
LGLPDPHYVPQAPPSPAPVAIWVTPRISHIREILFLGVAAFATVGAAVAFIGAITGADYMLGFKRLLDLNGERNLPTWFSSAILLTAAALLAGIAADKARPHRNAWIFLSAVFVFLSLDEEASIHEMSNAPLRALLHAGPALYFPWIIFGLALAALVLAVEWRLLRALPRKTAMSFVGSGAIYVMGAVGFEELAAPLYARHAHPVTQAALLVCEESLEMIGVALFIVALARFWTIDRTALTFDFADATLRAARSSVVSLPPGRLLRALLGAALVMAVVNVTLQGVHFLTPLHLPRLVRLFDLAREGNVPTWVQSYTLLACGALAGLIAFAEWQHRSRFRIHWVLTALFCVYLSADEASSIHEMAVRPLRTAFHTSGIFYYPWIVVGAAAAIAIAIASHRFIRSLPPRTRRTVIAAAVIYIAGALGVEALGGMYAETHGQRNLIYGLITTVEETLEMVGMSIAAFALLEYLRDHIGRIRLSIAG